MQPVASIEKFKGIVNAYDAVRAGDADNGVLVEARNVVIDNSGMILSDNLLSGMTKRFSAAGSVLSPIMHGGSKLTAIDNVIYFTDPVDDIAEHAEYNNLAFGSNIRMMVSVEDGLWVSDVENIYFLPGLNMATISRIKIAGYGVIQGSVVECNGSDIRDDLGMIGKAVIATTKQGICIFGKGGFFENVTQGKYNIPSGINTVTASFDKYDTTNLYTITIN